MNSILDSINTEVYKKCGLKISDFTPEPEGLEYDACQFKLGTLKIINRTAKITPKKAGQFVTFWKRNKQGITAPFSKDEGFDFYVVNVSKHNLTGQFVFPKSILIQKEIVATGRKDGKRGFRVYPIWDVASNVQAKKTQQWQLGYFYIIKDVIDLKRVKELYR